MCDVESFILTEASNLNIMKNKQRYNTSGQGDWKKSTLMTTHFLS